MALAASEQKRAAQQECMSATVQQIKEQVINLPRGPTTLAPDDIYDDGSDDDDDSVGVTPWLVYICGQL